MKILFTTILSLLILSSTAFGASKLDEKNITKMLDSEKVAKEHKNLKAMTKHFLIRSSVSLTKQDIENSETKRLTFNEYKRHLTKKWKKLDSNLIEIKDRSFNIQPNGKSALVKTTLVQTVEIEGVKTSATIYETTGIKLFKGKIYINYYSSRTMINTAMRVN